MTGRPLVVVGDALLDRDVEGAVERLSPDAPVPVVDEATTHARPGGAALAAALAAGSGRPVTLVTALARDAAGAELAALLVDRGVEVVDLGLDGATPEKIRITTDARPLLRLDRGGGGAVGAPGAAARAAIGWAGAVLVGDYGRGVAAEPELRAALAALGPDVPLVWDPHPNGPAPVPGVRLATPNLAEATALVPEPPGDAMPAVAARARALAARWQADAVCITCGARGAVLAAGDGPPLAVPAEPVPGGDPCGAGDRFASAAAEALADGATAALSVQRAVATASRFVAAGGAGAVARELAPAAPRADGEDGLALARRVGAAGGTVVATGGCFDLLHSGHVRTLEAARALGDCLVVLLNSDASVRTIKGAGRPVVGQDDRARVLAALRCVDAVVVFDEPTPEAALARVRPRVWAKGADYAGRELPEAKVLAEWGGEVVLLPLVDGQSTTRLIEEATLRAVR
jgi:rfaE bifunctional protein nucleotidyltransferase chain/domain/rfaE bifunctional protein kinase chain/domain